MTHFRRNRGRRLPFSCFFVRELIFGGTEGIKSRFHALRSREHFRWYGGRQFSFSYIVRRPHFRRYRGRPVPFSCFALPDSFSAGLSASGPVFMFWAPGLIFDGPDSDGSRFHVLCAETSFWRYRGRRVLFSCFSLSDPFSTVRRALGPVVMFCASRLFSAETRVPGPIFMFCDPGLIFGCTEGVRSHFHVLRS
jgi:hypothetical protein